MNIHRAEVLKVVVSPVGQMTVVIRCPHCKKRHWHGGGAGHRLSHCAGRKAEKLRREYGSLSYVIAQRDIDRLTQGAAA